MLFFENGTKKCIINSYSDLTFFMDILKKRTIKYLDINFDIKVIEADNPLLEEHGLKLRDLTSLIYILDFCKVTVAFSFDQKLMQEIFNLYTADIEIDKAKYEFYFEQTCCEIINIVVGNILSYFQQPETAFQLSIPIIIKSESSFINHASGKTFAINLITNLGNMTIFCVFPADFFLKKILYNEESVDIERT